MGPVADAFAAPVCPEPHGLVLDEFNRAHLGIVNRDGTDLFRP
ncbi:hypothetical protein J2S89_002181 [Arthrobacter bambusae]|nr:hypothetical protein [Arthrobacter bambusae]MDQ0098272.1 hypothetical protein [Arthrobacter bambusae]